MTENSLTEVTNSLPETYAPGATGMEDLDIGSSTPFLKLLQSSSEEVKEEGLKAGLFFHTGTGETFENPGFIPTNLEMCAVHRQARNVGTGVVARYALGDDFILEQFKKSPVYDHDTNRIQRPWGKFDVHPEDGPLPEDPKDRETIEMTNYVTGLLVDDNGDTLPFIYGFKSKAMPAWTKFTRRAKMLRFSFQGKKYPAEIWRQKWSFGSAKDKVASDTFFVPTVSLGFGDGPSVMENTDGLVAESYKMFHKLSEMKAGGQAPSASATGEDSGSIEVGLDDTIPF